MTKKTENPQLQQLEFFEVPSPCIGVCQANEKGYCKGCFRTREERLYWPQITDAARKIILQQCKRRARTQSRKPAQQSTPSNPQIDLFDSTDQ